MSHVPLTAARTMPFTPDALGTFIPAEGDKPAQVIKHPTIEFFLRVPTWEDRDMISLRMYAMNVREVTTEQIQAVIVSEIYEVIENDDEADDAARFLEGFWSRQRTFSLDMRQWEEQEAIRRLDAAEAKIDFEPEPQPAENTTPRERARAAMLVQLVTDGSQRLRDKLTDQQLYSRRFASVVARLVIAGWSGLDATAAFEPRPVLDAQALTKETIEQIRSELMEIDGTGAAWTELTNECERMFDLPQSAEKNSFSPPENTSPPDGSPTKNTASDTSDGNSTSSEPTAESSSSSIEPTPEGTSPKIIDSSSEPSPGSDTEMSKPGQTEGNSPTSLSD